MIIGVFPLFSLPFFHISNKLSDSANGKENVIFCHRIMSGTEGEEEEEKYQGGGPGRVWREHLGS
jgi:hypothetical protein